MSNTNYQAISDQELVERLERGEMQTNPELYAEFERRMEEQGTSYSNTLEDEEKWKLNIALSAKRGSH